MLGESYERRTLEFRNLMDRFSWRTSRGTESIGSDKDSVCVKNDLHNQSIKTNQ